MSKRISCKKGFILTLCLFLVLTIFPSLKASAGDVLIPVNNPDFEFVDSAGNPLGWTPFSTDANFSLSDISQFNGNRKLLIKDTSGTLNCGAESEKVTVNPFDTYSASANVYVEGGIAEIYLRFYDSTNAYISSANSTISDPKNQWLTLKVSATAPANAAKVSIVLYSSQANIGSFYADNIELVKEMFELPPYMTNLGVQVRNTLIPTGAIGKDLSGRDVVFTVITGDPGQFVMVDIKNKEILTQLDIPGVTGSWTVMQARDKRVYIGGYNSGYLYRYDPAKNALENLGITISGTSVNYQMSEANNGKIYGGAYPSGALWEYDPATRKFVNLGVTVKGSQYTRSSAYDPVNNMLYAGTGTRAGVVEINLNKTDYIIDPTARRDLLPSKYKYGQPNDIKYAYDLNFVEGKVFVRKDAKYEMIILDPATGLQVTATDADTGNQIADIPLSSRGTSGISPVDDKLYYTFGGYLYSYDFSDNAFQKIKDAKDPSGYFNIKANAIAYGFVQLGEEDFPGYSLVALVGNGGLIYTYNIQTGNVKVEDLNLPAQPVQINNILTGPDSKVYTNGYLSGNMGVYTPSTGVNQRYSGIGQAEGMTILGNKMYLGVYPAAKIYEYDMSKPWDRITTGSLNPVEKFRLDSTSFGNQDRTYAMLGVEAEGKVYIGTIPTYGKIDGAFTVYDPVLNTKTVYTGGTSLSPNQSIVSLAYKNREIFIGTTISGGLNSTPATTEAKLIIWDAANNQKVFETVPVQGKGAITGLMVGPDGNIWGMANGTLFIFDPQTREVIYSDPKLPATSNWRDAFLEVGKDGNVYGTAANKFFKINANTKDLTVIIDRGAWGLAQDDFGNLYMRNITELWKYSHPDLVVGIIGAEINVASSVIKRTESTAIKVDRALLEKGFTTKELSGAKIEYMSSNPNIVSISDGTIKGIKAGSTDVWAKVTLNGVTADSDTVTIIVQELPLSNVTLSAAKDFVPRNSKTQLNISATAIDGAEASLNGAQYEFYSSNPEVITISDGVAEAHNIGTSNIYVKVTLNGQTIQSNSIELSVTIDIDSIINLIKSYADAGKISTPMLAQLENSLSQARHQLEKDSKENAVKHLEDFLKHLNNKALEKEINSEVKEILYSDAKILINTLNEKTE